MAGQTTPIDLITSALAVYLNQPDRLRQAESAFREKVPPGKLALVESVLTTAPVSYRDGLMIQLAYGLAAAGKLDLTKRPPGARGTAGRLGRFLGASHIQAVADAYQNIAKNSADLARGNVPSFDKFLRWASRPEVDRDALDAAFQYVCAKVAATSRPVLPMPSLNLSLTFANVYRLFGDLLGIPSEGAHEQFIIAALMHGLIQQTDAVGYRVETKKLNSSDASSKVAGDIQVMMGSRTIEAYEVTAKDWGTKLDTAGKIIRDHDLSRLHIVAKVNSAEHDAMLTKISQLRDDVSVIEIRSYAAAITSTLTKQFRGVALERLYEFLDRYQGNVERVNAYVTLIIQHALTAAKAQN